MYMTTPYTEWVLGVWGELGLNAPPLFMRFELLPSLLKPQFSHWCNENSNILSFCACEE